MQDAFCLELLKRFKHHDLHTAVETCGFVSRSRLAAIAEYTDLFLFDCKETDPEKHRRFTGVDPAIILENLSFLNDLNIKTILRCPIVRGLNDTEAHFAGIAALAGRYRSISHVEIEPYHPLGEAKYVALDRAVDRFPVATEEEKQAYLTAVRSKTEKAVIFAFDSSASVNNSK